MTVNTFAAYDAALQRISRKTHTDADETLVMAWDSCRKLVTENKRLLAEAEAMKTSLLVAQASVRDLTLRLDLSNSRSGPKVSLESMLTGPKTIQH